MFKKFFADKKRRLYTIVISAAVLVLAIIVIIIATASDAQRLVYTKNQDGTYTVSDVKNIYRGGIFLRDKLTIPSTHKGAEVTSIKRIESEYIKEIEISEGILVIEPSAFSGMKSLEKVTIPQSVVSIGDKAFSTCDVLKEVSLPNGITSIGKAVFSKCFELKDFVIPESVKSIGEKAFEECRSLEEIRIGSNIKTIGNNAFYDCTNLERVEIDFSAVELGIQVFSNTKFAEKNSDSNGFFIVDGVLYGAVRQETEMFIPEGVKVIAKGAFYDNNKTVKFYLPSSLEKVEDYAFANSLKTKEVYFEGMCEVSSLAFDQVSSLIIVSFEANLNDEIVEMFASKPKVNLLSRHMVAVFLTKEDYNNRIFTLLEFDYEALAGYMLDGDKKLYFDKAKYSFYEIIDGKKVYQ